MVGDPEGVAGVVVDRQGAPPDGDVGLLGRAVDDDQRHDVGAGRVALGRGAGLAEVEQPVDGGEHAVVGEVAGRGDDEVAGPVPALMERGDVVAAHGLDGVAGAEGLAPERVLGVEALVERGEHEVVGGVLAHEDLLDDDLPLGVELVGPERRLAHDVGQQAQAGLELGHGQAQVVRRVLAARVGVHLAADGVDRHGDRAGRPLLGAFEQEVLEEVGRAGGGLGLVTRAHGEPHADADRPGLGHALGDDAHTRGQLGTFDAGVGQSRLRGSGVSGDGRHLHGHHDHGRRHRHGSRRHGRRRPDRGRPALR